MKTKIFLLLLVAFSLSLGACKHRNKCHCVSGKAVVASPISYSTGYGYQK